ncbi:MAG: ATP-binding protein [Zoogloeaceae bacterium]|nr:ATP-binding protein [Zoogloeaceae bacterium]
MTALIERPLLRARIARALSRSRVAALAGPRQVGKTTLARSFLAADHPGYFDLENPLSLARLSEPMTALSPLRGLVVIDEIQRMPELFPVLRVLADREGTPARFLLLGSASPALLRASSESLAGRIEVIEVGGFVLEETGADTADALWQRGGFPRSFLAETDADSRTWRQQFLQTLVERDLPQLGAALAPAALLRFLTMLAHYHGQIWNAAEPARSLGISEITVRRYLDLLTGTYLVRQLPPWFANIGKRQVRSPKIYWRDCGLLHQLLGIADEQALLSHPRCGASWEGFALEHMLQRLQPDEAYFWATHTGAELDALLIKDGRRLGLEIKRADAPRLTSSMRHALDDLELDALWVIYPGSLRYRLHERIEVLPFASGMASAKV